MEIEFLGHAGYVVTHGNTRVIMDPWMSASGAFDSAWFQFPCNHHLAPRVKQLAKARDAQTFLYISHEHKDHFDDEVLGELIDKSLSVILPCFRSDQFRERVKSLGFDNVVELSDGQEFLLDPEGELRVRLFVDDNQLNRDSAILIDDRSAKFLNLNDCKIFDRLGSIRDHEGPIDVFSCQFSGANWHPICYDYDAETMRKISQSKRASKLASVLRGLNTISPRHFFPSAGPASFLDPELMHLNTLEPSVFPKQYEAFEYLDGKAPPETTIDAIMPGDRFDTARDAFVELGETRIHDQNQASAHLDAMAAKHAHRFEGRERSEQQSRKIFSRLETVLATKAARFNSIGPVPALVYYSLRELPGQFIRIDLNDSKVTATSQPPTEPYYHLEVPGWQIERVLNEKISWEDLALTFRVKLRRVPDAYDTLINGFFFSEPEDLPRLIKVIEEIRGDRQRIVVKNNGARYEIDKICPHQGADLSQGWADGDNWVCPRHRWCFDLESGGQCTTSSDRIHSVRVASLEAEG